MRLFSIDAEEFGNVRLKEIESALSPLAESD